MSLRHETHCSHKRQRSIGKIWFARHGKVGPLRSVKTRCGEGPLPIRFDRCGSMNGNQRREKQKRRFSDLSFSSLLSEMRGPAGMAFVDHQGMAVPAMPFQ